MDHLQVIVGERIIAIRLVTDRMGEVVFRVCGGVSWLRGAFPERARVFLECVRSFLGCARGFLGCGRRFLSARGRFSDVGGDFPDVSGRFSKVEVDFLVARARFLTVEVKGVEDDMAGRDWRIFFASDFIDNGWWAPACFGGVGVI